MVEYVQQSIARIPGAILKGASMKTLLCILTILTTFSLPAYALVDINTASQSELETISGVGPKKAQAIIEYRKKNGPFKSADDLDKVPGFGKKTVDAVRKDITVGNTKAATAGKSADLKTVKGNPKVKPANKTKDKN